MDRVHSLVHVAARLAVVCAAAIAVLAASPAHAGRPRTRTSRETTAAVPAPAPTAAEFAALEQQFELQQQTLDRLQGIVERQSALIDNQQKRLDVLEGASRDHADPATDGDTADLASAAEPASAALQSDRKTGSLPDERHSTSGKADSDDKNLKRWGKIKISGQVRMRFDTEWDRGLDSPEDLNARNRLRFRVRVALSERLNDHCDWGLRFTSGEQLGDGSENQTFDNFFSRKPFDIDRAFIHYTTDRRFDDDDERVMFEATAGKQPIPWEVNSVNIDDQLQPEGLSQTVMFKGPKDSAFKDVGVTAWQMVFNQRNNNSDAILYGVNVKPEFQMSENWGAKFWLQLFYLRNFAIVDLTGQPAGEGQEVLGDRHPINGIAELAYSGWGDKEGDVSRWQLALRSEWIYNAQGPSNGKNAWDVDVQLGRLANPGDWLFEGLYYRVGTNVFPLFLSTGEDLDSNAHGTEISASYLLEKKIQFRARYIGGRKTMTDGPINRWFNRFQFDVTYGF